MNKLVADEIMPLGTSWEPPPPDFYDPVIEFYKKNVNREELRANLKLTVAERMEKFAAIMRILETFYERCEVGQKHPLLSYDPKPLT